jgi:hypothetical protein
VGYASEYRSQAVECCRLARTAVAPEHRKILMQMAAMWLTLAKRRETMDQAAAINGVRDVITTNKVAALTDKVVALKRHKPASIAGDAGKGHDALAR